MAACGEPSPTGPASRTPVPPPTSTNAPLATTASTELKGELTIWAWNTLARSLQANLDGFAKLHPAVKIKIETIERLELYRRLTASLTAGGVNLPDIVAIEGERLEVYVERFPEALAQLTEKAARYEKDFDPARWELSRYKDKLRALPWDIGPVGMFYRVDMFEKAGVKAAQIETWDDFVTAGKQVQAANPGVKLLGLDFEKDDTLLRSLLNQQGRAYFTSKGLIDLNSAEAVAALGLLKKLKEADLLLDVPGEAGLVAANKNGLVATQPAAVGWSGVLTGEAPELKGKWDVMPLPAFTKGGPRVAQVGGTTLAITRNSKNFEAAWAFIEYNLATRETQLNSFKKFGLWPTFLPAQTDAAYNEPQPYFNNKPVWKLFASQIPNLKPGFYTFHYDKAITAATQAQASVLAGSDPASALQKATDQLKQQTNREVVAAGDKG